MPEPGSPSDPRVHFAAERTLLAWLRTGLAMMGFGFVVAKFGIFLREISRVQGIAPPRPSGLSHEFGTALIVLGAIVTVCAAANHVRTLRLLERNESLRFGRWPLGVFLALLLAAFGMLASLVLLAGTSDAG